jgi:hypothetical protein
MTEVNQYSRPSSSLAIISLVSGILGVTILPFIGSIVAVITAPMAMKEITQSNGALGGEDVAKIGQILGWVGIVLFGFVGCCCLITFAIPFLATLGVLFSEGQYYWQMPELMGSLF